MINDDIDDIVADDIDDDDHNTYLRKESLCRYWIEERIKPQ